MYCNLGFVERQNKNSEVAEKASVDYFLNAFVFETVYVWCFLKLLLLFLFFFFFAGVHYIVLTCVKFALSKGVVLLFFLT